MNAISSGVRPNALPTTESISSTCVSTSASAWIRDYWKSVERFSDGFYTNEISDETERVVNGNYQGNYDRLLKVKNRYDPNNLFRLNANITPTV